MVLFFSFSVFTSFDVEISPLPFVTEPLSVSDVSGSVNGSRLRVAYQVPSSCAFFFFGFNRYSFRIPVLLCMVGIGFLFY